jgi:acetylornithine/succinyldiaminopimelate/putrescine aminotransferase
MDMQASHSDFANRTSQKTYPGFPGFPYRSVESLLYKETYKMIHLHSLSPMNSRAEAVETTIKAARKWEYRIKATPDDMAAGG